MFKIINIKLSEEIIIKIIKEYNSIIPKGCDKIKIHKNWQTGFEINVSHYCKPIKKICIWENNYLNTNGLNGISYSDAIILYLSFQNILGKDNVKFI